MDDRQPKRGCRETTMRGVGAHWRQTDGGIRTYGYGEAGQEASSMMQEQSALGREGVESWG